eukprot:6202266-Pleurochrysis_carterae.AAC.1
MIRKKLACGLQMPNLSRSPGQYYMTATMEGVCFPSVRCVPFDRVACMLMRGPAHSFLVMMVHCTLWSAQLAAVALEGWQEQGEGHSHVPHGRSRASGAACVLPRSEEHEGCREHEAFQGLKAAAGRGDSDVGATSMGDASQAEQSHGGASHYVPCGDIQQGGLQIAIHAHHIRLPPLHILC